ncbi:BamA/TamA family outer membrane protein [Pseudooceanicola marinus]|uniref:BamA/TamA family outer membrane protein n=1 Tax=Pseudooceanicola marinus TaxID=396013 RepID=UPI001CD2F3E6|nr:BamA/TamA family outer membrane protein [Pseudooceanicola marinus]MCA1337511.1 BamA/TamA family outer membrane protein [Pseudooceanicola marinus]
MSLSPYQPRPGHGRPGTIRKSLALLGVGGVLSGAVLIAFAPVGQAQVASKGAMIAGAGVSSVYGATADLGLEIEDLFSAGIDLSLDYRLGDRGQGLSLDVEKAVAFGQTALGADTVLDFGLTAEVDEWDFRSYRRESYGVSVGVGAAITPQLRYRVGLFHVADDLSEADDALSPLIQADMGDSDATGLEASLSWSNRQSKSVLEPGADLGFAIRASGLGDSREFTETTAHVDIYQPVFGPAVLNLGLSGGVVRKGDDGYVAINERAFLGGDMPRGFAYGGIGPIDASTGDALGGTRYVAATLEVMVPTARPDLAVGAFWDAATLSDLPGIDSPNVDDSAHLRQSVGLSLAYQTKMGEFTASIAEPIEKRDGDDVQNISFSFTASF